MTPTIELEGGGPQYLLAHFRESHDIKCDPTGIYVYDSKRGYWCHYSDERFCELLALTYEDTDIFHTTKSGRSRHMLDISEPGYLTSVASWCYKSGYVRDDKFFQVANPGYTCRNGYVEFRPEGIKFHSKHNKNFRSRFYLDFDYDPAATAPNFEAFLGSYFAQDEERDLKIQAIMEAFGFIVTRTSTFDNRGFMLWFTGEKGTGKTTLVETCRQMFVPPEFTSYVAPQNFTDQNELNLIRGMALNTADDVPAKKVFTDINTVKAQISGMPITIKSLFYNKFQVRLTGTGYICTANRMPIVYDESGALQSRFVEIRVPKFAGEQRLPAEILETCLAERAGAMNLLHRYYYARVARPIVDQRIILSKSSKEYQEMSIEAADAIGVFCDNWLVFCPHDARGEATAEQLYAAWGIEKGEAGVQMNITKTSFLQDLRRRFPGCYSEVKSNGLNHYRFRFKRGFTYFKDGECVAVPSNLIKIA